MALIRRLGQMVLAVALASLAAGLVLVLGSALWAGDWWLAREPWIGWGMALLVLGLAATACSAAFLDVVEPIGWLRLLALPPALVAAFFWMVWLVLGVPTTGFGGPAHDVATILYSMPETLALVLAATLLIPAPLLFAHLRGAAGH